MLNWRPFFILERLCVRQCLGFACLCLPFCPLFTSEKAYRFHYSCPIHFRALLVFFSWADWHGPSEQEKEPNRQASSRQKPRSESPKANSSGNIAVEVLWKKPSASWLCIKLIGVYLVLFWNLWPGKTIVRRDCSSSPIFDSNACQVIWLYVVSVLLTPVVCAYTKVSATTMREAHHCEILTQNEHEYCI